MEVEIKQKQEFDKIPIEKLEDGEAGIIYGSSVHNGRLVIKSVNHYLFTTNNHERGFDVVAKEEVGHIFYLPIRKLTLEYFL